MAIEYIRNDGAEVKVEVLPTGTNIELPQSYLKKRGGYREWYLRVESPDSVILFFFGEGEADHRWALTVDDINEQGKLAFYREGDIIELYRWRESTAEEKLAYSDNPPLRTNIPRPRR